MPRTNYISEDFSPSLPPELLQDLIGPAAPGILQDLLPLGRGRFRMQGTQKTGLAWIAG